MFGSTTIEIAIGVIVVFILVSTICTAIREGIESVLKTRAAYLEQGIRQLLNDTQGTGLAKSLYNHPLVFGLFNGDYSAGKHKDTTAVFANGKNLPSYIPSKNFARALMDIAAAGVSPDASNTGNTAPIVSLDNIRQNISNIGNPPIQRMMLNAIDMAQGDLNKAQANIENWFNSGMDRVSGWYKRSTQSIIFVIALFVAVGMNVNTITIINYLAKSDTARKIMIKQAEVLNKNQELQYTEAQAQLNELNLPIGWDKNTFCDIIYPGNSTEANAGSILFAVFGWLITAFAATLGAPYWFDLLNRVMVIRSTVKPHEKSLEEGSQDNRNRTPDVVYMAPQPAVAAAGPDPTHEHATADSADIDGCDVPFDSLTADDELPESKGGDSIMSYSLTWLADVLLAAGLKVAECPGWKTCGVGEIGTIEGIICHHTATTNPNGNMPSLNTIIQGRACAGRSPNWGWGATALIMLLLPAGNHAGAGNWHGVTGGNSHFIGIEAENMGVATKEAWPEVQMDAYRRGVAAILRHIGKGAEACTGHKEYATPHGRKTDPNFDMDIFRQGVARILNGEAEAPQLIPVKEPGKPDGRPTLRRGIANDPVYVKIMQQKTGVTADGYFGPKTEAALRAFQKSHGAVPDGIAGPKTWKLLDQQG